MKTIATFLLVFATFYAHAQGLIWSSPNVPSLAGNSIGAGPLPNRQIGIDYVSGISDPLFPTSPSLNPVSGIFSMTISTNDAGLTFFANALNTPGYAGFVAGLTDGANNYIRFQDFDSSTFGFANEDGFLARSPDLAGYNITQIGFRVSSYYDYFDVGENRYFNQLNYSLDFYGAPVPEPGTWALLGLGGALLWPALRRRGK